MPLIAAAIGFTNTSNHGIRSVVLGLQSRDQRVFGVDRQNFRSLRESQTYDVINHSVVRCCRAFPQGELFCPAFRSVLSRPPAMTQ